MPEPKTDVNPSGSSTEEQAKAAERLEYLNGLEEAEKTEVVEGLKAIEALEDDKKAEALANLESLEEPPSSGGAKPEARDEGGVPIRQIHAEFDRKYKDLVTQIPEIIAEVISKVGPQQAPQRPQYTREELVRGKAADPEHAYWYDSQLRQLETRDLEATLDKKFTEERKKQTFERDKQQAGSYVRQVYPEMFKPDGSWDMTNELGVQTQNLFNSIPAFKKEGFGLAAAADMAFGRLAKGKLSKTKGDTQKVKRQLRKAQIKTLLEGGGSAAPRTSKTDLTTAAERHAASGKKEDLISATKALLKAKGLIPSK